MQISREIVPDFATENIDFLRTPTKTITFPLSPHIEQIITDLKDTFKATPCAGIAANQIGYNKKLSYFL